MAVLLGEFACHITCKRLILLGLKNTCIIFLFNEILRNPHFNFKYEALWPVYQGIPDTSEDVNY